MITVLSGTTKKPTIAKLPFGCCWQTSPEHPGPRTATGVLLALSRSVGLAAPVIVSRLSHRLRRAGLNASKTYKKALEHWENVDRFAHVSYDIQGGPQMFKITGK